MGSILSSQILLIMIVAVVILLVGIGIIIFGIYSWINKEKVVTSRLEHYVVEQHHTKENVTRKRILPRETAGSILKRVFVPGFHKFVSFISQITPSKQLEKLDHDLVIAGNPFNLRAGEFFSFQFLFLIIGLLIGFYINFSAEEFDPLMLAVGIGIAIIFLLLPKIWLNSKVREIQDAIRLELPDALDMLSVCANAGLGFDQSLQKISAYWDTPFGNELKRVIQEMEMGISRSQALRNLSSRMSVDDLSRFISIIVQAETMGMSYAEVLHSQALQMRILRQYRAREIANRLPAKMILPLVICIFPAILAVIIGPIMPTLLDLF
jgi:tight adherence protein C